MMSDDKVEINIGQTASMSSVCFFHTEMNNAKNMGTTVAIALFAGTLLLTPFSNDCWNNVNSSYIKSINLDDLWENKNININKNIDLLKVQNINKINKMKLFDVDWNGHGAPAYSQSSIHLYMDIIEKVCKQPQIAPTGKASMLMQYELNDKSLLAFDVSVNKVEMVLVPQGDYSKANVEVFTDNICKNINLCVEKFYGIEQN